MTTPGGAGTFWKAHIPRARRAGFYSVRLINPGDWPLGEHPGWNGVALPGLQGAGYSPLLATMILAQLVAGWHLPPFFMEEGGLVPSVLVAGLVTTMAVTFWYAWLFNHTAGSVLLVVMAHSVPLGGHRTLAQLPPPLG